MLASVFIFFFTIPLYLFTDYSIYPNFFGDLFQVVVVILLWHCIMTLYTSHFNSYTLHFMTSMHGQKWAEPTL